MFLFSSLYVVRDGAGEVSRVLFGLCGVFFIEVFEFFFRWGKGSRIRMGLFNIDGRDLRFFFWFFESVF